MLSRLLTAFLLLLLFPRESPCLINNAYLGEVTVSVEGAKRSKPALIESLVERCLRRGDYRTWESVNTMALGQCVSNSRLFAKVEVTVDGHEIRVTVAERWTLIPVPYVYAGNDRRAVGLFIFESNVMGYGKTLGAGGALSTEGNTASLFFVDPAVNFSDYTFTLAATRSANDLEAYEGTAVVYAYRKKESAFVLMPGYRITPNTTLALVAGYADRNYEPVDSYALPQDHSACNLGINARYSNSDYKLFFNDGLSVNVLLASETYRSDGKDRTSRATAKVEWDIHLFDRHALQLGLNTAAQFNTNEGEAMTFGRSRGFRGIQPNGLWTDRIISVYADYQVPYAQLGHGTFTVAPFADYGRYKPYFAGPDHDYIAYGLGTYYFINRVNLAGVGLYAGINENFMGPFVAFQLGMTFN